MASETIEEREIGDLVDLLKNGIKIADRLVAVNEENELELGHRRRAPLKS